MKHRAFSIGVFALLFSTWAFGQSAIPATGYTPVTPRALGEGEIPITAPGYYGTANATYVLMNDIVSPRSAIFLGNNTTLDLNGYEITYADGGYENIPNFDFEEGLVGWDFSKAPTAKIGNKLLQVFVGENVLQLKADEEITSQYISLPEANRSYFAMCGVAALTMRVSVYIEDEQGDVVYSNNSYGGTARQGSPVENKRTQLGGGFVFAHMFGKPAGRYRVRIKANTDAIVDYIDLRPALDVGVGIVERTYTNAHNDQLFDGWYDPAFYDYTLHFGDGTPLAGVPVVAKGTPGTIAIRNGVIRNGVNGVLSWGIQSTTSKAAVVMENVKVVTQGINTNAVEVRQGKITRCHFDVSTPFIINRHNSGNYAVDFLGTSASEVSHSEFYGGQGCLSMKSVRARIHHNLFVNRQMVTNHYAVAAGDSSEIYSNVFKPESGSGIGVGRSKFVKVYDNEIHVTSSPPTCEYGKEDYSVNGVRLSDYNAPWGDPRGCYGNEIFNNTFIVTGKDFPEYPKYIPIATAIFYSASAGDNFIFDNRVVVNAVDPDSKAITNAFYVGGGTVGGVFENNTVTGNTPAFWIASPYGAAKNVRVVRNTIVQGDRADVKSTAVRLGHKGALATDIDFISNEVVGGNGKLTFSSTNGEHTYSVGSSLILHVVDAKGTAMPGTAVRIFDNKDRLVLDTLTADNGVVQTTLVHSRYFNGMEHIASPHRIVVGDKEAVFSIEDDIELTLKDDNMIGITRSKNFTSYINPVTGGLILKFPESIKREVMVSSTADGIHVKKRSRRGDVEIDLSSLKLGMYSLQVEEKERTFTEKLMKF